MVSLRPARKTQFCFKLPPYGQTRVLYSLLTEYSSPANKPAGTAVSAIFNTYNAPTHAKHNEI